MENNLPNQELELSKKNELNEQLDNITLVLPSYTIVRKEVLSKVFNQIKIYITIDDSSDAKSLFAVCEKIHKDYKQFSNIVICLFI